MNPRLNGAVGHNLRGYCDMLIIAV
jgi:hypothetical protein